MKYAFKWLLPYWKKYKYRLLFIVILGIISATLQAFIPFYIKKIINGFEKNLTIDYLKLNVGIMLILGILHFIVNLYAQRNRAYMNYKTEYEVRNRLFSHILSLDESLFLKYSVGEVLTRLVDDISEKIAWFSCSGIFRFIQAIFTLIALLFIMFYINWKLTLIALIPFPFMVIFITKMRNILIKNYEDLQKSITDIYDYLETSFNGIRIIKANLREMDFGERFNLLQDVQREKAIKVGLKEMIVHMFFFFTAFVSIFMIYLFGGIVSIKGALTVGDIVSFQVYAFMLIWPCSDISQFFVSLNRASVSMKRVDEILNFKPKIKYLSGKKLIGEINELSLKDIYLSIDGKVILKNINLKVSKGEKICVVGKIGSGKTVLLKVIARILPYEKGEFLVSGIDINEIDLKDYQNKIAYVSQEPMIMSDSILNNITMYKNYAKTEIEEVIKVAQLEEDILRMPQGINTIVGNKGSQLSGGQKQRLAIARALLKKPQLLIMDDATNQMDAKTEAKFWEDFYKFNDNIAVILVTHRVSTIEKFGKVIVLSSGEIVEKGTHQTLISQDTLYKKIYKRYELGEK